MPAPQQQIEPPPPKFRQLLKIMGLIFGSPVALLSLIYAIAGPPWPTEPIFSPGFPSSGFPLDAPFIVTNKSVLFRISNLGIKCHLISARMDNINVTNVVVSTNIKNRLNVHETRPYTCPFRSFFPIANINGRFSEAEINFTSEYDSPWPWVGRTHSFSSLFSLDQNTNPPQWVQGLPMQ